MFDRKEYDKERARKLYVDFQERRAKVLVLLGNKCYLCDKEAIKGFHLHHKEYDPVESNYPTHSKSMSVRFKRLKEAETNPKRFRLLCPKCHFLFSKVERFMKDVNKKNLIELLG
jgi:hypothetical protein